MKRRAGRTSGGVRVGTHLEDQHPGVSHSQAEFTALAVFSRVETDAVHLQPPGDLQQLVVGLCRSVSAVEESD